MSFFRRTQSKVWWGDSPPEAPYKSVYSSIDREVIKEKHKNISSDKNELCGNHRQGSPSSHKSMVRFFIKSLR